MSFMWHKTVRVTHRGQEVHEERWAPEGKPTLATSTRWRLSTGGPKYVVAAPFYYACMDERLQIQIPGEDEGVMGIRDEDVPKFKDLDDALDWLVAKETSA